VRHGKDECGQFVTEVNKILCRNLRTGRPTHEIKKGDPEGSPFFLLSVFFDSVSPKVVGEVLSRSLGSED
jgi:hypothetical protein